VRWKGLVWGFGSCWAAKLPCRSCCEHSNGMAGASPRQSPRTPKAGGDTHHEGEDVREVARTITPPIYSLFPLPALNFPPISLPPPIRPAFLSALLAGLRRRGIRSSSAPQAGCWGAVGPAPPSSLPSAASSRLRRRRGHRSVSVAWFLGVKTV